MDEKEDHKDTDLNGGEQFGHAKDQAEIKSPVVERILELETRNKQLVDEKRSLEHQLFHVLERCARTGPQAESKLSKDEVKGIIRQTLTELSVTLSKPRVQTKAPLARPDYSGFRSSLTESVGEFSVADYSSLSDTYEEICLNKDVAQRLLTSESSQEQSLHDSNKPSTSEIFPEFKIPELKHSTSVAPHSTSTRHKVIEKMKQIHKSAETSHFGKIGKMKHDLIQMQPREWPLIETSTSNLSLINISLKQCTYETDSTQSSAGSCSIFSSSTESVSISQPSSPTLERTKQKTTSSLPCSPLEHFVRTRAPSSVSRQQDQRPFKMYSPSDARTNFPKLTSREEVIAALRKLYDLPTQPHQPDILSKGPPKVKIARRQFKQPVRPNDSSETSVSSWQESQVEGRSPQRFGITNHEVETSPGYRGISIRAKKQAPLFSKPSLPQKGTHYLNRPFEEYTSNILNSVISMEFGNIAKADDLFEGNDFPILNKISQLITGLDTFTRYRGQCILLHRLRPPYKTYMPILYTNYPSGDSHESSDLTSDVSMVAEPRIAVPYVSPITHVTNQKYVPINASQTVREVSSSMHTTIAPDEIDELSVLQSGTLFRLSNRLKIWRLHNAELTLSALTLYMRTSNESKIPKYCIPVTEIRALRKPHNLSTSINTGLKMDFAYTESRSKKLQTESVPVTRKFIGKGLQTTDARTNFGHFELLLHNGKSHCFRGANSTETDLWLAQIRRVLRISLASELLVNCNAQLVMQGWLQRIKRGEACWFWCRLLGHYLVYARSADSKLPSGYKSLLGIHIRTVETVICSVNQESNIPEPKDIVEGAKLPVDLTSSSDSDILITGDIEKRNRTIALWSDRIDPVYLVCRTRAEFEQWRDNLIRACQQITTTTDPATEQSVILARLVEVWRLLVNSLYSNQLHHTDEPIKAPLSKTTEKLGSEMSIRLFNYLLFLSYPKIEYKRSRKSHFPVPMIAVLNSSYWLNRKYFILRFLTEQCLDNPHLKDELYLQIIKQVMLNDAQMKRLTRRCYPQRPRRTVRSIPLFCTDVRRQDNNGESTNFEPSYGLIGEKEHYEVSAIQRNQLGLATSEVIGESKITFPTSEFVNPNKPEGWWPVLAVWECVSILLTIFLPSTPVLKCLDLLLLFFVHETPSTSEFHKEVSRYAAFCRETIQQTLRSGGRLYGPSALEIASISIRNPYTHKHPFSMPICLPINTMYEVVCFSGGTNFYHLSLQIIQKLDLPNPGKECPIQYAIYLSLYGVTKPKRYVYLKPTWKVCDVIALYEKGVFEQVNSTQSPIPLEKVTPEFCFRIQTFAWKRLQKLPVHQLNSTLRILVHQLHTDILNGVYVLSATVHEFVDLVTYLCVIDHSTYTEMKKKNEYTLTQIIHQYFPKMFLSTLAPNGRGLIQLKLLLLDRWTMIGNSYSHSNEHTVSATDSIHASISYLRRLRRLLPQRFSTAAFAARAPDFPGNTGDNLIWVVPEEFQLNILRTNKEIEQQEVTPFRKPRTQYLTSIPYSKIQSFGTQSNGAFYIVYFESIPCSNERIVAVMDSRARYNRKSKQPRKNNQETILFRNVKFYFTDLNTILELTDTLNFYLSFPQRNHHERTLPAKQI